MKKLIIVSLLALGLSGCATAKLVPQVYMPTPPSILMTPPEDLKPITPPVVVPKK